MENKEVEAMLEQIKVEYALLEGKLFYQNKDVERLSEDNKNLTKRIQEQDSCIKRLQGNKKNTESYIRNLKQQLQAKDKALDKACKELELSRCRILNFRGNDVETKEDWKEWVEK